MKRRSTPDWETQIRSMGPQEYVSYFNILVEAVSALETYLLTKVEKMDYV
jgi:hypothetical protein